MSSESSMAKKFFNTHALLRLQLQLHSCKRLANPNKALPRQSGSNCLRCSMGRFNVLRIANHTNRTLSSLLIHDPVTERGSHFFKGLLLGFPEQGVLAS
jgi:hypothetical protein